MPLHWKWSPPGSPWKPFLFGEISCIRPGVLRNWNLGAVWAKTFCWVTRCCNRLSISTCKSTADRTQPQGAHTSSSWSSWPEVTPSTVINFWQIHRVAQGSTSDDQKFNRVCKESDSTEKLFLWGNQLGQLSQLRAIRPCMGRPDVGPMRHVARSGELKLPRESLVVTRAQVEEHALVTFLCKSIENRDVWESKRFAL